MKYINKYIEKKEENKKEEAVTQEIISDTTMIPKIIKSGYKLLDLMYYFTCGPDEVRAWTLRRGSKTP